MATTTKIPTNLTDITDMSDALLDTYLAVKASQKGGPKASVSGLTRQEHVRLIDLMGWEHVAGAHITPRRPDYEGRILHAAETRYETE